MKSSNALGATVFGRAVAVFGMLAIAFALPISAQDDPANSPDSSGVGEPTEEELQAEMEKLIEGFGWERTGRGKLKGVAEIAIPEGFRFTGEAGTKKLMELFGNSLTNKEHGTLAPEDLSWFVVFEFDKVGYVPDDEKDDIDAGELLAVFKKGQEQDNQRRRQAGLETLTIAGWAKEPFYNEQTNNLEWALKVKDEAGIVSINYKTKLLGRRGVMESILVCDGDALEEILPTYQNLIADFKYAEGNAYAEYKQGDKIAEYGLKGLIVGGGIFAAAKLGFFGVLMKFLGKAWIFIVAILIAMKGFIVRLFGGGKKNEYTVGQ